MTTPSIEQQLADAQAEASRLRDHNATLLSEKKQLQKDFAALQEQHATASAELTKLRLDGPVDALVTEVAADPVLFKALFAEKYQFALDADGRPCIQTKDSNPVVIKGQDGTEKALPFDADALRDFLAPRDPKVQTIETKRWAGVLIGGRASGGAATGGSQAQHQQQERKPQQPEAEPLRFGLR